MASQRAARKQVAYRRILLKLSGEAFQNKKTGGSLDPEIFASMALQLKRVQALGPQIAIVIGGGNIFRGMRGESSGIARTTGDYMGMLATVINCMALQSALERIGCSTRVMTAISMPAVAEPFILRRALRHLDKGRIVIFGAGTGNPFFTTDSAAALRASEIEADVLLKATNVDGIYSADPRKDPAAKRFSTLTYMEALQRRLKIMDAAAFSLCMENRIPIVVFDFFKKGEMEKVVLGGKAGTRVSE
jgi:uridylate kinase